MKCACGGDLKLVRQDPLPTGLRRLRRCSMCARAARTIELEETAQALNAHFKTLVPGAKVGDYKARKLPHSPFRGRKHLLTR